jgi:hypothetical protein
MKLRFLGQTYSSSNISINTVDTENTARFLGQIYTLRRPVQHLRLKSQLKSQLGLKKYRGVSYDAE